ncbi:MAG: hypothetical protein ACPLN2_07045 [Thermoproteota archaeon]
MPTNQGLGDMLRKKLKATGGVISIVFMNNTTFEKWKKEDEEARKIRRKFADWSFIEKQDEKTKAALVYYVEAGDIRQAIKIAEMNIEDFVALLKKANIPMV